MGRDLHFLWWEEWDSPTWLASSGILSNTFSPAVSPLLQVPTAWTLALLVAECCNGRIPNAFVSVACLYMVSTLVNYWTTCDHPPGSNEMENILTCKSHLSVDASSICNCSSSSLCFQAEVSLLWFLKFLKDFPFHSFSLLAFSLCLLQPVPFLNWTIYICCL